MFAGCFLQQKKVQSGKKTDQLQSQDSVKKRRMEIHTQPDKVNKKCLKNGTCLCASVLLQFSLHFVPFPDFLWKWLIGRLCLKCDGTYPETRFRLSAKRTSPFKSVGASVQSTTGSRSVRISGSNAGYTMFQGSVKGTGYPLYLPVSPSLPLLCVTVCHHIPNGLYLSLPYSGLVLKYYQCSVSLHNVQTVDCSPYSITLTDFKFMVMGIELVIWMFVGADWRNKAWSSSTYVLHCTFRTTIKNRKL